jgi:hypothetical protein
MTMKNYSDAILAIEANDFTTRAVIVRDEKEMLDSFEAKTYEVMKLVHWVRNRVAEGTLHMVGSPLDTGGQQFHHIVGDEAAKFYWLPPDLVRKVFRYISPWQRKRRLHRARLLAYIGHTYIFHPYDLFAPGLALRWEYCAAREIMREVTEAAQQFGIQLDKEDEG